jgi:hypothetical protein
VYPSEKTRIRFDGRTGLPNLDDLALIIGTKALFIALEHWHHVKPENLFEERRHVKLLKRPRLQGSAPPMGMRSVRITYRFLNRSKREYYVHTFDFIPRGDGLDGWLVTRARKFFKQ